MPRRAQSPIRMPLNMLKRSQKLFSCIITYLEAYCTDLIKVPQTSDAIPSDWNNRLGSPWDTGTSEGVEKLIRARHNNNALEEFEGEPVQCSPVSVSVCVFPWRLWSSEGLGPSLFSTHTFILRQVRVPVSIAKSAQSHGDVRAPVFRRPSRSEEHTSELQSR